MSDDQFEKLAQLIKGAHDDLSARIDSLEAKIDSVDSKVDSLQTEMNNGFAHIHAELADIRADIAILQEKGAHHSGFAKEIDHVLQRVRAIEKHLRLNSVA
jgi:peptidoglycan hydrolase CwlO-like protein